jgi:hypothetical protein
MFSLHPATALGIVDESAALDLLLAAWGVNKRRADNEARQQFKLRRALNRELAILISYAVNGEKMPELSFDDEPQVESEPQIERKSQIERKPKKIERPSLSGVPEGFNERFDNTERPL